MVIERSMMIDEIKYTIVLSDETNSLHAAHAAGKAVIGIWHPEKPETSLFPADYVVERLEDISEALLERAVRRRFGLPFIISHTDRLLIREFTIEDLPSIPFEEEAGEEDQIFLSDETLYAYIKNQYGFFEYGIWAVIRHRDNRLVGKAGISPICLHEHLPGKLLSLPKDSFPDMSAVHKAASDLGESLSDVQLSYHIFRPYRRQGYGLEACQAILPYTKTHISPHIFLRIHPDNQASLAMADRLGFRVIP
ncbi:GNAT family N-acetyltransferase [Lachnospiraceae bacterium 62-35]